MTSDPREALLAKRAETVQRLDALGVSFDDIVEAARDSNLDDEHDPEGTTVAVSRAQVSSLIAEGREALRAVDAALRRLDDGTYGACVECGAAIGAARLEARPAATTCIACATAASRRPR